MKQDGLKFNEKEFEETKQLRPRKVSKPPPSQFDLLKQMEKDLDIANMPGDLRELEKTHDITTLTDLQLQQATRKLTAKVKARFYDRIKMKKLEKLFEKMYLQHLKDFGLDKAFDNSQIASDDKKVTTSQMSMLTISIQESLNRELNKSKQGLKDNSKADTLNSIVDIMNLNQRDFEREILRELRPEIDSARRLIDVIDEENQQTNPT